MFTLFYVAAEMWGDVVLSLLFWGLANEMTSLQEAPLLYPLFWRGRQHRPDCVWEGSVHLCGFC